MNIVKIVFQMLLFLLKMIYIIFLLCKLINFFIYVRKSFVLSTFGYTMTAFVMGIMQVWIPTFMTYSELIKSNHPKHELNEVGYLFF